MTTTPSPHDTIERSLQTTEAARLAEGQANLARDELYLARQDVLTAQAREFLDRYSDEHARLSVVEREARRRFRDAVREGRFPGAEWIEQRTAWWQSYHLHSEAEAATSTLQAAGLSHPSAPIGVRTWRDPRFLEDLAAALEDAAEDAAVGYAETLTADRVEKAGGLTAPTRPGDWEEWTATRPDGAVMRVEKNHDTNEMVYTVLIPPPADAEPDEPLVPIPDGNA